MPLFAQAPVSEGRIGKDAHGTKKLLNHHIRTLVAKRELSCSCKNKTSQDIENHCMCVSVCLYSSRVWINTNVRCPWVLIVCIRTG